MTLSPCGVLSIQAEGLSEEVNAILQQANTFRSVAVVDAVRAALQPELLAADEDAANDLRIFKCRSCIGCPSGA
ncbi:MAG: hypothetical protein SGJ17_11700 [Hyphomicrobiales bacterium]|nr:hypothetical protein [Hyphomicrobiales bacterium]